MKYDGSHVHEYYTAVQVPLIRLEKKRMLPERKWGWLDLELPPEANKQFQCTYSSSIVCVPT